MATRKKHNKCKKWICQPEQMTELGNRKIDKGETGADSGKNREIEES